jgi:glycosyltransferase involved in cell wall biosynthesis
MRVAFGCVRSLTRCADWTRLNDQVDSGHPRFEGDETRLTDEIKRPFADIFATHDGKVSDKWQSYISAYENLFAEFRDKRIALLEIGIQNGGSLEIYSRYFTRPEIIVGCDINSRCRFLQYAPGIKVVVGNCTAPGTVREITALSSSFDIIIDDGSHISDDVIAAFLTYFPLVRAGGIYVIEDLHTSYWQQWQGGLFHRESSIAFLKLLVDAINVEHWGIGETISDLIAAEFPEHRSLLVERALREIKSVNFANSMCVIRKAAPGAPNALGTHLVKGSEAAVEQSVLEFDGEDPIKPDERDNPDSIFSHRAGGSAGPEGQPRKRKKRALTIAAVMPVYNGEHFLHESIRSVLNQTLMPHEFIIVDDASTDGSRGLIEKMCSEYPITFIKKDKNSGQSASRNLAIKHCNSDLIALIDQDDRWYPNHLEELVKPFRKHREGLPLGWTYSDFDDIDEAGKIITRSFIGRPLIQNPKRDLVQVLVQGALTQPSATLISRAAFEAVGGFDENLSGFEDEDLFLRMFRANYDNSFIPHPLSQWRIYDWSSGASDRMAKSQRYYIRKLMAQFPDDKWRGHYYARDVIAPRFILTWIHMYLRAGRYKDYKRMREYAWDIWDLVPHVRIHRRISLWLAFPILLWPRAGEVLIKASRRYRHLFW